MNRIDRLFGILVLLQSKKFVEAELIAEKFNISVRTVYRDIKALNETGVPVSFETGRGYFIVQGYFIPPVSFTPDEANALVLMETFTLRFADKSIQDHYTTALTKVKAVLKGAQKERLENLQDQIITISCNNPDGNNNFSFLSKIQEGISNRTVLEIDYKKSNEEMSCRKVEAIGLVFYAYNWHLIGWCQLRKDYRDFRVSRIVSLAGTSCTFSIPEHISLNEYMQKLPVNY